MDSREIRKRFFEFFTERGHAHVPSSSLIPAEDPTLLFANAGMNQFKNIFLGTEKRSYTRAVSIQKCIRAGGKHNDLENVGFTRRHLTFFEMMGNFSFGDYFKKEAIEYAWEFLTKHMHLPVDKLYASVYAEDDESWQVWNKHIGLAPDRIIKLGAADNFWQMGDTGPCGPCTEIYFDRGPDLGCGMDTCAPGCDCARFVEIWNLVFMQYNRLVDGTDIPLSRPGVDTGMGFERLCMVIQNTESVYESDALMPLIKAAESITGISYDKNVDDIKAAFRVVVDHVRSSSMALADGVIPSNEGRGYVLRKIIRRAALFSQKLNDGALLEKLASKFISSMGSIYPELEKNRKRITATLARETKKFAANLISGQAILEKYFAESKNEKISGGAAFKLYDTYGFPLELTKVIAHQAGFAVDIEGFEKHMEEQRKRSGKKAEKKLCVDESVITHFTGYDEHMRTTKIIGLLEDGNQVDYVETGKECYVITKHSPFYVECGGQISDQGVIKINNHEARLLGLEKINNAIGALIQAPAPLSVGDEITLIVDSPSRLNTMKNHTATHLLQAALISVLGDHVKQSGSVVAPDYLRFDFTYEGQVTAEELVAVERLVNKKIMENIPVSTEHTTLAEAQKRGVIAFFGEKYNPEDVRVVGIPGFSHELCGGTHVRATGDIGVFKITEISTLGAGNKRIIALTGPAALGLFQEYGNMAKTLSQDFKVPEEKIADAVAKLRKQFRDLQLELKACKKSVFESLYERWITSVEDINTIPFLYLEIEDTTQEDLKQIATQLAQRKPGFYFLVSPGTKISYLAHVSPEVADRVDFKGLIVWLRQQGLRGGGKPPLIQGGGESIDTSFAENLKTWMQQ